MTVSDLPAAVRGQACVPACPTLLRGRGLRSVRAATPAPKPPDLGKYLARRHRQRKIHDLRDRDCELHFNGADLLFFDFTTVTWRVSSDNQNDGHRLSGLTA